MESSPGSSADITVTLPRATVLTAIFAAVDIESELPWNPDLAQRYYPASELARVFEVVQDRLGPPEATSVRLTLSRADLQLLRSLPSTFLDVIEDWEINARSGENREDFERAQRELDAVLGPLLDGAPER